MDGIGLIKSKPRVLVGCEYSQVIMSAFFEAGADAWSCDILPSEGGYPERHIQGDLLEILDDRWDLAILHPPCTFISYAGTKYWNTPGRVKKRLEALDFFRQCWEAPIKHLCIENPIGCADAVIEKHSQIIHPYFFGDIHYKRTCLWLKGLPKLIHIKQDDLFDSLTHTEKPKPIYIDKSGKKRHFTDSISGKGKGGHRRSKSFPGIANAMVQQWLPLMQNENNLN